MNTEYSVDEVRAHAAILRDWRNGFAPGVGNDDAAGMLDAYASLLERIAADEWAVPVAYLAENANEAFVFFANDHESLDAYTADGFSITPLVRYHRAQEAEQPHPPAQAAQVGRTAKDYAIEHAGYLADAAEHLMTVTRDANIAADQLDEDDGDDETNTDILVRDNDHAQTVLSEAQSGLRAAIYEFKKRRDRAAEPAAHGEAK